jgi:hypothetical protein
LEAAVADVSADPDPTSTTEPPPPVETAWLAFAADLITRPTITEEQQ